MLASKPVYGVDKAAVEVRRPSQARDLGPVVLPHRSLNPLPPGHCSLDRHHPKIGRPRKVFQSSLFRVAVHTTTLYRELLYNYTSLSTIYLTDE